MFGRPDHTYNDIREKSLMQWLDEMEQHPDIRMEISNLSKSMYSCIGSSGALNFNRSTGHLS